MERTIAIIKPDAFPNADSIKNEIQKAGFTIVETKSCTLSKEECGKFYIEHYGKPFFADLQDYMSSGPVMAMMLTREKAISMWRKLLGPTNTLQAKSKEPNSLRAKYGTTANWNGLHGSDSYLSAEREIEFFFPQVERRSIAEDAREYLLLNVNPILIPALVELNKKQPPNPIKWLSDYLLKNAAAYSS